MPLHVSVAFGRTALLLSSQSVLLETYPAGAEHAKVVVADVPNPSPSASR